MAEGQEDKLSILSNTGGSQDFVADPRCKRTVTNSPESPVSTTSDTNVKWSWLCAGHPKRCECGFWLELKQHDAPDKFQMPN